MSVPGSVTSVCSLDNLGLVAAASRSDGGTSAYLFGSSTGQCVKRCTLDADPAGSGVQIISCRYSRNYLAMYCLENGSISVQVVDCRIDQAVRKKRLPLTQDVPDTAARVDLCRRDDRLLLVVHGSSTLLLVFDLSAWKLTGRSRLSECAAVCQYSKRLLTCDNGAVFQYVFWGLNVISTWEKAHSMPDVSIYVKLLCFKISICISHCEWPLYSLCCTSCFISAWNKYALAASFNNFR